MGKFIVRAILFIGFLFSLAIGSKDSFHNQALMSFIGAWVVEPLIIALSKRK